MPLIRGSAAPGLPRRRTSKTMARPLLRRMPIFARSICLLACLTAPLLAQCPPGAPMPTDLAIETTIPAEGAAHARWLTAKAAFAAGDLAAARKHLLSALEFHPASAPLLFDLLVASLRGVIVVERPGRFRLRALGPGGITLFDLLSVDGRTTVVQSLRDPEGELFSRLLGSIAGDLASAYDLRSRPSEGEATATRTVRAVELTSATGRLVADRDPVWRAVRGKPLIVRQYGAIETSIFGIRTLPRTLNSCVRS